MTNVIQLPTTTQRPHHAPQPSHGGGLTPAEVNFLRAVVMALPGEWACDTWLDGRGCTVAGLVPQDQRDGITPAFIVSRDEGSLVVADIRRGDSEPEPLPSIEAVLPWLTSRVGIRPSGPRGQVATPNFPTIPQLPNGHPTA